MDREKVISKLEKEVQRSIKMDEPFEHCPQCKHYNEDQSEYHYCHVCVMDHDCYQKKDDSE